MNHTLLLAEVVEDDNWRRLVTEIWLFLPRLGTSVLIVLVFWLAGSLVVRFINRLGVRTKVNADVLHLLEGSARIALIIFGAVTAFGTLGVNVGALIAGLGLTGFAVGFAVKDIISNALAGMMILIYEPFQRNDHVSIGDLSGNVVGIDFRYTTLQAEDRFILVPNANLFTKEIIVKRASRDVKTPPV